MEYTKEQLKAAYALNLCTVSVSQIIDYEDINVMEQEYEAILNNLNLEEMPKDEALLKILKQILDTITYFRIEDGDKKFIDKEYQHKMKNAIWSAVPNIGLLVAGGNPVTMAVSLASQVGIGYMNYRKEKADNDLERERNIWELEKTAIEQFNGLRRELFDTAWRLSAAHNFPDQLRLTERQIKQYNNVLMDGNLLRKYARLDAIKDSFLAYPPFWYYFGNTANAIARSDYKISDSTRIAYREKAKECFVQFRESNGYGLLREDEIFASCALELVDLLDIEQDRELIETLLEEAIRTSGRANDVMQLAAITYLKLNNQDEAATLLTQLVNEQYNTILNAQLLSSVLVSKYIAGGGDDVIGKYEILKAQVGADYLYPLPELDDKNLEQIEAEFVQTQKHLLLEKYNIVATKFFAKYMVKCGKLIPVIDQERDYPDSYFMPSAAAKQERKYQIQKIFANNRLKKEYLYQLSESNLAYALIDLLNEMFETCCNLDFMNKTVQYKLAKTIKNTLYNNKNVVNELKFEIENNRFDQFSAEKLIDLDFQYFAGNFMCEFMEEITKYVDSRVEMQDFALAEDNLSEFCKMVGLPSPSELVYENSMNSDSHDELVQSRFNINMLTGEPEEKHENKDNSEDLMTVLSKAKDKICLDDNVEFYMKGDPRIERYFRYNKKLRSDNKLMADTLAVLDDKANKGDFDLIFTTSGVVPVINNSVCRKVAYRNIEYNKRYPMALNIDGPFASQHINLIELNILIKDLSCYATVDEDEGTGNGPLFGFNLFKK